MTKLIVLDDGHGMLTAGKRTPAIEELGGRVIHENEFNKAVVKFLDDELKRNGFKTLLTAPTDEDVSLKARTDLANAARADLFISIHYNALNGIWGSQNGFSAHVYLNGRGTQSGKFALIALKHLSQGTKQTNRGLVEQNLHIVRETKMPAVLFELGFMDNKREALLMLNVEFQKECAVEIAKAVCEFYSVTYKAESKPVVAPKPQEPTIKEGTLYRVRKTWADAKSQVGAYKDLDAAERVADANKYFRVFDEKGVIVYQPEYDVTPSKPVEVKPVVVAKPKFILPSGVLKKGAKGAAVLQLQKALIAANFYPDAKAKNGGADSIFGVDTENALKRFQSIYCNPNDGIYGSKTKETLDKKVN